MDGHGSRLLESGLEAGSNASGGAGSSGGSGGHPTSVAEFAARVATPTSLSTLGQYHNRFGLTSAMPGSNFALMSTLLSGGHSSETRKAYLPELQHYWNNPTESFPRYLMAGSLYPPYPPLLPGAAESLSLLGAGVACVAGGASTGAGPSQSYQVTHYQRLLEMQKEAYLASMSAAASHHPAIYGISTNALPPFLDQTTVSPHDSSPLSLVKQEPKELSCTEKSAKQGERRAMGFKVDLDLNRSSTSSGNTQSPQVKEPKLSPSSSMNVPGKIYRNGSNSKPTSGNNNGHHNSKKLTNQVSQATVISCSGFKMQSDGRPHEPTPPMPALTPHKTTTTNGSSQPPSTKKGGPKSSGNASKRARTSGSDCPTTTSNITHFTSSPPLLLTEFPIMSVPTKAAAPIPLATVQHDGVVLSALASPSSAAASSISTKSVFIKQQTDVLTRLAATDKDFASVGKSVSEVNVPGLVSDHHIGTTLRCEQSWTGSLSRGGLSRNDSGSKSNSNYPRLGTSSQNDDSKQISDDSSDIVVDSTEKDDVQTIDSPSPSLTPSSRAVEETIEQVASLADSEYKSDQDDVTQEKDTALSDVSSDTQSASRMETSCAVTSSGAVGTRTVSAKAQPVYSVAVSGSIPVGIAVAQIRPHHVQQSRGSVEPDSITRDVRHEPIITKTITQTTSSLAVPAAALATTLVVAGPTAASQSPWLPQVPFPLHQAGNSSGITAPSGFKFAHDSLTGRIFLVPNADFVEQGGVWPSSFSTPTDTGSAHHQTTLTLPGITVSAAEKREGKSSTEDSAGKNAPLVDTLDKIIPTSDTNLKDKLALSLEGGRHNIIAQPVLSINNSSAQNQGLITPTTAATILVNTSSRISSISPSTLVKVERPAVESRGCSPIYFEEDHSSLSILSAVSSLSCKKPTTSTIGVQTCESLMKLGRKRKASPQKQLSHDQAVQTSSPELHQLNPLSVHCPELDAVDHLTSSLEVKSDSDRSLYNPFTDPQILQAADGLELLSTLAEKRPKCSSLDDPKRIFPSPSDSFKSDSASVVAFDDTLSPGDSDLKSGQCTPRREMRRDLSPKWSLPKKESQVVTVFGDFKAPSEIEIPDDSEMRVKLAEVQRQYKEKQKELAKLQIKKTEECKQSKRGPGRPPKKKTPAKKSDDDSSSSSSKTKDSHQPQKKKRPAEELVDRVFRKLPPVIKPGKVSRSIHYVKSKTGPFFRRKSASIAVKQNKDMFGYDESNWPSYSERKHQEKVKGNGSISVTSKNRHRSSSSLSEDSKHGLDAGNIFTNLESFGVESVDKRGRIQKQCLHKHKVPSSPGSLGVIIKTEPCLVSPQQESGLGLLAKFALTTSMTSSTLTTTPTGNNFTTASTTNSFCTSSFSSGGICASGLYNSCSTVYSVSSTSTGVHPPSITFGSVSSFMFSTSSGLVNFNSPGQVPSVQTPPSVFVSPTFSTTTAGSSAPSPVTSTTASVTSSTSMFPSPGVQKSVVEDSSSGASSSETNGSGNTNSNTTSINNINRNQANSSPVNITLPSARDPSPPKRKSEEDSDTDTSDTSPNKKRKPGRPRKINPDTSTGGTETIWAKKSSSMGLLQVPESSSGLTKDGEGKKLDPGVMKPLFLDEEWTRRRSERIFLSETSPQPSPALSPSPRGEPVWKLSHFMPKSKKMLDVNKSLKESDKDCTGLSNVLTQSVSVDPAKASGSLTSSNVGAKEESKTSAGTSSVATKEDNKKASGSSSLAPKEEGKKISGTSSLTIKEESKKVSGTSSLVTKEDKKASGTSNLSTKEDNKKVSGTSNVTIKENGKKVSVTSSLATKEDNKRVSGTSSLATKEESKKTSGTSNLATKEENKRVSGTSNLSTKEDSKRVSGTSSLTTKEESKKVSGTSSLATKEDRKRVSGTSILATKEDSKKISGTSSLNSKNDSKETFPHLAVILTHSAKNIEVPAIILEDAKKIMKSEDPVLNSPPVPLLSLSEKPKKNSKEENTIKKKKKINAKNKKNEVFPAAPSSPSSVEKKEKRAEEHSRMKLQKAKSLHDLTQRVKKKFSNIGKKKQEDNQLKKSPKAEKKKRKMSTDSSDTDNLPLVKYRDGPPTPEPRCCKLQLTDLREGLKVLYHIDGLFHEGTVKVLQPPDIYGVLTAGQRGNRPHILCLEEILKWAVLDVKPGSVRYLPEGARVCAFWSQQFSCLYPGTVAKSSPTSGGKKVAVAVEFDDGDNGRIELDHIRLLPSDFPIVEYEPDPLEALPKRKQRATSDASDRRKSVDTESKSQKHSKEDESDGAEESDDSSDDEDPDDSDTVKRQALWKWVGKSTKRPGLKGKAKKEFYKSATRGRETIRVGDSAVFVSKDRVDCPYIGRIENLWQGWNGQMMVKVQWYYHPEETESNKKLSDPKNALFESQHEDENDVQTIAHKCEVLPLAQYKKRLSDAAKRGKPLKDNVFYLAGFYDPAAKIVTFHPGVS